MNDQLAFGATTRGLWRDPILDCTRDPRHCLQLVEAASITTVATILSRACTKLSCMDPRPSLTQFLPTDLHSFCPQHYTLIYKGELPSIPFPQPAVHRSQLPGLQSVIELRHRFRITTEVVQCSARSYGGAGSMGAARHASMG